MTWFTKDGTRKVEVISLDGRPHFLVTDPRHACQAPAALGYVPVRTAGGLLSPATVARLAGHGVDLADLDI